MTIKKIFDLRAVVVALVSIVLLASIIYLIKNNALVDSGWATVNYTRVGNDKEASYSTFKINYPKKYIVTDDNMLTSYVTQGGQALPALVFYKRQITDVKELNTMLLSRDDCVVVHVTGGVENIEGWRSVAWLTNPLEVNEISRNEDTLYGHKIVKRIVQDKEGNTKSEEVAIFLPEGVSYYFQSCNENSSKDLEEMIKTFETRADTL